MQVSNDILIKFPAILHKKLLDKEIELPDTVEFHFEDIHAYRCITRKKNDTTEITKNDFKSNAELGRKNIRGESEDVEKKPEYYGVSLFQEKTELVLRLKLPQKNRKIIKGNICQAGGPILRGKNTHVCWWLYEEADISGFELDNDEE